MAHSRPKGIADRGEGWRVTHAAGAFVAELATDARVRALYEQWYTARRDGDQALTAALQRARVTDEPALWEWMKRFNEQELDQTRRFVVQELRLSYHWVAAALLDHFRLTARHTHQPAAAKDFCIPVLLAPGVPKGRQPKGPGLEKIRRHVQWFYRLHVKAPVDQVKDLAAEYKTAVERNNECHSAIYNGAKQAKALLDLVEARHIITSPSAELLTITK